MSDGKSARPNQISAEVIKACVETTVKLPPSRLFCKIWEKEEVLAQWKDDCHQAAEEVLSQRLQQLPWAHAPIIAEQRSQQGSA